MEFLQPQLPESVFITILLPAVLSRLNFQCIWWKKPRRQGGIGTAAKNKWLITGILPIYLR